MEIKGSIPWLYVYNYCTVQYMESSPHPYCRYNTTLYHTTKLRTSTVCAYNCCACTVQLYIVLYKMYCTTVYVVTYVLQVQYYVLYCTYCTVYTTVNCVCTVRTVLRCYKSSNTVKYGWGKLSIYSTTYNCCTCTVQQGEATILCTTVRTAYNLY